MDFVFSQLLDPQAEDLLTAVSWFRDNEERRRHFFARDGDARYAGKNFLLRLWPTWKPPAEGARSDWPKGEAKEEKETASAGAHDRRRRSGDGSPGDGSRGDGRMGGDKGRRRSPGDIVSPYELLGLSPDADEREIHRAFQRLAIHYHPDKVYHLGEEFRQVAHQKFTELKDAYETLLRRRKR